MDVCEYLLSRGAKVNHHDNDFQTALMWAAASGHIGVVRVGWKGEYVEWRPLVADRKT